LGGSGLSFDNEWKESELGLIPINWTVKRIKEIGEVIGGGTPSTKRSEYYDGDIPWITPKDLSDHIDRYIFMGERSITKEGLNNSSAKLLPKGTVLFSSRAPIGYVAIAGQELCTNQGFKSIVCNESVNNLFIYYTMKMSKEAMESIASGSTFKEVSGSTVKEFKIKIPPLREQKEIAGILSSLDDKIELNNAINKNIEEMAQALFKRWFVDFEFPNKNGEPYKSSGGEFEESELGLIPKGWRVDCLEGIADYLNGLAMQKYRSEGEQFIPVIKIKELNQGRTSSDSDKASLNIDKKYIVNNGDVLFSWSGTLEIKLWCGGIGGLNQHLFKVTSNIYDKWFYYYWTKHHIEKFRRIASDKATTMGHIKRSDLKEAKVLIPDRTFYRNATAVFQPIVDKMIQLSIESYELEKIRDTLLPKLMSGEIRVPVEQP
jgi:type I restriction enzyme S subunit